MTYSWHRYGGSVPSRSRGQNTNTLTVPIATPPDEGIYYCMANKEGISVESNRARVRVDGENDCRNEIIKYCIKTWEYCLIPWVI